MIDAPWWLCGGLIVLLAVIVWFTDWLAWNRGRLFGLHEADQRNQHQLRLDFSRGMIEGVRRAAVWLRANGRRDEAARLPDQVLLDKIPSADPH